MAELEEEIEEKDEEIRKLKDDKIILETKLKTIENNDTKTKIINYNTIAENLPVLDLSEEYIQEIATQHFTEDHLKQGQEGIATFIFNHLIKSDTGILKYICVDQSRRNGIYKDNVGIVRDTNMERLTSCIYSSLKSKILIMKSNIEEQSTEYKNDDKSYVKNIENINSKNKSKFKNMIASHCYIKNMSENK